MAYKYTSYIIDKDSNDFLPITRPVSPAGELYDNFIDAPVKNAHGFSQYSCVDVSQLECGAYNVSGYFKLSADSEVEHVGNSYILMIVTLDKNTEQKLVMYDTVESGVTYSHVVTFNNDRTCDTVSKTASNTVYWKEINE